MVVDPRENKRSIKYFEQFTAVQTRTKELYIVLVVFTIDGNNIFFPIDDKPKNQKNLHYFKRVKKYRKKYQLYSIFTRRRSMWNSNYPRFKTSL